MAQRAAHRSAIVNQIKSKSRARDVGDAPEAEADAGTAVAETEPAVADTTPVAETTPATNADAAEYYIISAKYGDVDLVAIDGDVDFTDSFNQ